MIKRVQIEGFKSFGKLDFEMKPLNVLIGPNGGGKTNFLDFFKFLRQLSREGLFEPHHRRGGSQGLLFRGSQGPSGKVRAALEFERFDPSLDPLWETSGTYTLSLWPGIFGLGVEAEEFEGKDYQGKAISARKEKPIPADRFSLAEGQKRLLEISGKSEGHRVFRWLGFAIESWAFYEAIDTRAGSGLRQAELARAGFILGEDGANLTSVLHNLQNDRAGEEAFARIEEILHAVFSGFKKLLFPAEGGDGMLVLKWREEPGGDFSATFLSDGTLKFLCLLTIFLCPTPPPLVMIEEPELGLHPDMIHYVAALAQEASHRTQIIMTTHSPTLVSALKPEEVVVVEKVEGSTEMRRLSDRPSLEGWLKDFSLGELWQMGEIGGRP